MRGMELVQRIGIAIRKVVVLVDGFAKAVEAVYIMEYGGFGDIRIVPILGWQLGDDGVVFPHLLDL